VGPIPESEARELAGNLELFRSVVSSLTGTSTGPSPIPLRVYALGRAGGRRFFDSNLSGFFIGTMRGNLIALRDQRWASAREILQHEYVHFLLRNSGIHGYPPWYDEGFAEFLSTLERGPNGVDIGRPIRSRTKVLWHGTWIPLGDLMALRSFEGLLDVQIDMFYAQSWALVHYLNLGRKDASTRSELATYLNALRDGASDAEAVESAFGERPSILGRSVIDYVQKGRFRFITVDADRFQQGSPPEMRVLPEAEVARALGRFAYDVGDYETSRGDYSSALAANPKDPRSLVGLANALAALGRWAEADAYYERALAAGPDDAVVHLDIGNSFYFRALTSTDAETRGELASRAREHLVESWKLDDSIPETYARYGSTYLLEGEDPSRGIETLEHAHRLLPASPEIKLSLAELYADLGRLEEAQTLTRIVSTWSHTRLQQEAIQELQRKIDRLGDESAPPDSPGDR